MTFLSMLFPHFFPRTQTGSAYCELHCLFPNLLTSPECRYNWPSTKRELLIIIIPETQTRPRTSTNCYPTLTQLTATSSLLSLLGHQRCCINLYFVSHVVISCETIGNCNHIRKPDKPLVETVSAVIGYQPCRCSGEWNRRKNNKFVARCCLSTDC